MIALANNKADELASQDGFDCGLQMGFLQSQTLATEVEVSPGEAGDTFQELPLVSSLSL